MALSCANSTYAQSSSTQMGGRAAGVGYAVSNYADVWSVFNNPAGLASIENTNIAVSCDALPGVQAFTKSAAAVAVPLATGTVGAGIYRFGDQSYSEALLHAAVASSFGLASLGLRITYIQYSASGFGSRSAIAIGAGGKAQITPQLSVAATLQNVNQPRIAHKTEERFPTILSAGLLYQFNSLAWISIDVEKDFDYKPVTRVGLEIHINSRVRARTGVNLHPNAGFLGFGFEGSRLQIDYSVQYLLILGSMRHQATIAYQFKRREP